MLSDQDQELLEAYLDDALSPDEVERIARRLTDEPELASALDALRRDRRARVAAWESLQPDEAEASAFAKNLIRSMHRQRMMSRMSWVTRLSGAAAACMLMGLGGGWYVWGRPVASVHTSAVTPVAVNSQNEHPPRQIQFVNQPVNDLAAGTYQVELTDDSGKVLAVQKFNKLEEAQHFAQDLGRVVERQQDVQNGHVTLAADHF